MNTLQSSHARRQHGSGLIEVLVLILVMGIGMLSMGRIHTVLMRDASSAANRAIAASLAQEKLDDLRSFLYTEGDATRCGNGMYCYSEMAGNAGGSENPDGSLRLPAFPTGAAGILTGNTEFFRTWTVTPAAGYNSVTVTISWVDASTTDTQSVVLQSAIWKDDASITAAGADGSGGLSFPGPKVSYTPIGVPDAVPVEIGDDKFRESSKPVPDVSQNAQSTVVRFDTTSYTTPDNTIASRDEFVTVSCVCEFDNSGRQGRTPTRMVWNSARKQLEPELGSMVTKTVGKKPTTGQEANQDPLCDQCCRDHHDTSGYPKYSPQRTSHAHYYPDNLGVLQAVTSGFYLEACRMRRIDGLFYVVQDWLLRDLVTMPKDDYLGTDAALASYQAYLEDAMAYHGLGDGSAPNKSSLAPRNFLELAQGQQSQLLTRGIYVDKIYQCRAGAYMHDSGDLCPAGNDPTVLDGTYTSDVLAIKASTDTTDDWRRHIPFFEVNLTMLATWVSDQPSKVTVDNQPLQDILDPVTGYYTTYYRGRVTGAGTAGPSTITASARIGNTGLTSGVMSVSGRPQGYGLDPQEEGSGYLLSDAINVTRAAATATFGISGNLELTFTTQAEKPKPNSWGANASPSSGVLCASTGTANNPGYSCAVPSGWSGTITPFATAGGPGNDPLDTTTYYFNPTSRTHSGVTAAVPNQHFKFCKVEALCQ